MRITSITSKNVFTLLIVAFVVHNLEEVLTMAGDEMISPISAVKPMNNNQFLVAVSLLTFIVLAFYLLAMKTSNKNLYLFISTTIAASILLNVFIPHVAISLYMKQYTSGLFTALFLNLPFCIVLLRKQVVLFETRKQMIQYISGGLIAGYGIFAGTVILAKVFI